MNLLLVASFSFTVMFLTMFFVLKLFPKLGLMDRPWKYGLSRKQIPYPGGVAVFAVFVVLTLLFVPFDNRLLAVLAGAGLLVLVSFLDDRFDLSPLLRLFVQFLAVLIVLAAGVGIEGIANPLGGFVALNQYRSEFVLFGYPFEIVWLADLLVLVWVMVLINTLNWLDGLSGLSSGVSAIGFLVLFLLSIAPGHLVDQTQVMYLSLILAILCFVFWLFDFPPAKVLLGDSGSMFFGFMLAVLSIFAGAKLATTFLLLGLPILDVIWVILRRIFVEKRSPVRGDLRHFHHRLLKAGLSERKALFLIYFVCAAFGFVALYLHSFSKLIAMFVLILIVLVLAFWVVRKEFPKR